MAIFKGFGHAHTAALQEITHNRAHLVFQVILHIESWLVSYKDKL